MVLFFLVPLAETMAPFQKKKKDHTLPELQGGRTSHEGDETFSAWRGQNNLQKKSSPPENLKTNISPENWWLENDLYFLARHVKFSGCNG